MRSDSHARHPLRGTVTSSPRTAAPLPFAGSALSARDGSQNGFDEKNSLEAETKRPRSPGADPSAYRIGSRIRRLRLDRSMGLVELGRHTGLSASLLSKLETGKSLPTLLTLQRIAMVFSVGLDHFFRPADDGPMRAVVRRSERLRFPDRQAAKNPSFWFESLDFPAVDRQCSTYYAEFEPADEAGRIVHEHEGSEFIYVLEGTLGLWHGGEETTLARGDSVFFDSSGPHGYRRLGEKRCTALVVAMP
jgi:transcriptional regulator with XRE-family HTH domain